MDATVIKPLIDSGVLGVGIVIQILMLRTIWVAYNARLDAHIADLRRLAFNSQSVQPAHAEAVSTPAPRLQPHRMPLTNALHLP